MHMCSMWLSRMQASYILILRVHSKTPPSCYGNTTSMALVIRVWLRHWDGFVQSQHPVAAALSRQSYISRTNWVSGQPLVRVWIGLIGSRLSRAFVTPNRQLTKTTWSSSRTGTRFPISIRLFFLPPFYFVSHLIKDIRRSHNCKHQQKSRHLSCFLMN